MIKRRAPKRVWDFGMVYESDILSRISRGHDGKKAWRESQETLWALANGRTLSSMTYVGIGIHLMTGKNQSSEDGLVFPTAYVARYATGS